MDIGIFARTFPSTTLEDNLDALEDWGFQFVHFNLKCAALDSLPSEISEQKLREIRTQFEIRDLEMVALSGTFNAIDPNLERRKENIRKCRLLIEEAPSLGTHVVTLCTGTRDSDNMWRGHPENDSLDAWRDLIETLNQLVPMAEDSGVVLGVEPEIANVINTAEKARALVDEFRSPSLGIVLDGANLIREDRFGEMEVVFQTAVELLGDHLLMVHAKDIPIESGGSQAAGQGRLDWRSYFVSLQSVGFVGPVILHNLSLAEVTASRLFVENTWRECLGERG